MNNIVIGADEIILWLRKNNKKSTISNKLLGKDIHDLIVHELNGNLIEEDKPCIWQIDNIEITNELFLPKTAAQYTLSVNKMTELYNVLLEW